MLRRIIASALILGTPFILDVPSAIAQTSIVDFSGTVSTSCIFLPPSPGQLVLSSSNVLANAPSSASPRPGSVGFLCSAGSARVTVSAPFQRLGPTLTPTACSASIALPSGTVVAQTNACSGTSTAGVINGQDRLNVDMSITSGSPIPAGSYGYSVTLTIVP
jgi:hypothetical protein